MDLVQQDRQPLHLVDHHNLVPGHEFFGKPRRTLAQRQVDGTVKKIVSPCFRQERELESKAVCYNVLHHRKGHVHGHPDTAS